MKKLVIFLICCMFSISACDYLGNSNSVPEQEKTIEFTTPPSSGEPPAVSDDKLDKLAKEFVEDSHDNSSKDLDENPSIDELKEKLNKLQKKNGSGGKKLMNSKKTLKNKAPVIAKVEDPFKEEKSKSVYIVLGTFKTEYFFQEMMKKALEVGEQPVAGVVKGKDWKSVKVGPYGINEAKIKLNELKEKGFPKDIFIK